jgi:eukaryotic-like serine/threonine-protein kinase
MQERKPVFVAERAPRSGRAARPRDRLPRLDSAKCARRDYSAGQVLSPAPIIQGLEPGALFGLDSRFEVQALLGSGGSSVVLLVRDFKLGRNCAAKFLLPLDGEPQDGAAERARLEAQALAALRHENIVGIHDLGSWEGRPFILMEYSEGETLESVLERDGALPLGRALELGTSVLAGLEHAHTLGILHLDLKPGNLWLPRAGGLKILDFGIGANNRSDPSFTAGTPAYMAPEQWHALTVDVRTDIWCFGALLHEAVCGELPHDNGDMLSLQQMAPSFHAVAPLSGRFGTPPSLDALFERALAPKPSARFQSVAELCSALELVQRDARRSQFAPCAEPSRPATPGRASRRALLSGGCFTKRRSQRLG